MMLTQSSFKVCAPNSFDILFDQCCFNLYTKSFVLAQNKPSLEYLHSLFEKKKKN